MTFGLADALLEGEGLFHVFEGDVGLLASFVVASQIIVCQRKHLKLLLIIYRLLHLSQGVAKRIRGVHVVDLILLFLLNCLIDDLVEASGCAQCFLCSPGSLIFDISTDFDESLGTFQAIITFLEFALAELFHTLLIQLDQRIGKINVLQNLVSILHLQNIVLGILIQDF